MDPLSDTPSESVLPNAQNVWMLTDEERKSILTNICERIIAAFIAFKFQQPSVSSSACVYNYATSLLSEELIWNWFVNV